MRSLLVLAVLVFGNVVFVHAQKNLPPWEKYQCSKKEVKECIPNVEAALVSCNNEGWLPQSGGCIQSHQELTKDNNKCGQCLKRVIVNVGAICEGWTAEGQYHPKKDCGIAFTRAFYTHCKDVS